MEVNKPAGFSVNLAWHQYFLYILFRNIGNIININLEFNYFLIIS